ncbi:MAG: tRNA (adenosine(37)-N6)-threonylcarbamoyltransferase complex dimerization subunit type 1 TsaB [Cyclobacteriaceae bacterium]|nr:tRNA (adenosine(37)-N6)-threonylcarbamoyltransferase complex dimerization subunit type 1 TsaB [Cyclobacteriaceae bacterium]
MNNIISIETATPVCSVSLYADGKLQAMFESYLEKSHSKYLTVLIQEIVRSADLTLSDINAVAVSKGPGSYTGLRIGTSTAKGLCFGLDIPLISVDTLEAMACGVSKYMAEDILLCPMLDARRMEVYSCIYDHQLQAITETEAIVIDSESFTSFLGNAKIAFFGNGAAKCKNVIQHPNAIFIDGIHPSAKDIGTLACRKFATSSFEDLPAYEPFYLKEFLAKKPKSYF